MHWHTVLQVMFVVATAAAYYLARLPVSRTGALVHDGAQFAFAAMVLAWLVYAIARAWRESLTSRRQRRDAADVHSVPRRFGLGTLFVIILAFALLVTGLKLLNAHPVVMLGAVGYFAVVGGLQMAFDRAPRQASLIAGGILVPATLLVLWIAGDDKLLSRGRGPGLALALEVAFNLACYSVVGSILGYLIGILVGSVFMVHAALRGRRPTAESR